MLCLGLDVGSTSVKGAVLDLERRSVHSIQKEAFPAPIGGLPAGYFEVAPDAIVSVVQMVITRLLNEAPTAHALFCSGQMGGTILVDDSGRALTNYLSWRDQRTLQVPAGQPTYLDQMRGAWQNNELAELGNELQPGSTTSLLYWLARQNQLPDRAMPSTVADFVIGQVSHAAPQMHPTHAIGLLDLRAGTWHRAAFEKLGLQQVRWPQIAHERTVIGEYVVGGKKLRCHASFGDQQCALRGVNPTRDELSLNVSTGSQVSRRTGEFTPGPYQSRCFFGGDYLNTITHLPAGRSLNVLFDLLTELSRAEGITLTKPWQTIAQAASAANGGGLHANLAFFAGPFGSKGAINDITTENLSVGNLFHAAFQNMADNYAACADRLCPQRAGLGIALSGGLTHSVPILKQLIQDRLQAPIRESTEVEETLMGLLEIAREIYCT